LSIELETSDGGAIIKGEISYKNIKPVDIVGQLLEIPSEIADMDSYGIKPDINIIFMKLDMKGEVEWENIIAFSKCNKVIQTKGGGYLLVLDKNIVKLNKNGKCDGQGCIMIDENIYDKAVRKRKCQ
jgi:hypothetical protein